MHGKNLAPLHLFVLFLLSNVPGKRKEHISQLNEKKEGRKEERKKGTNQAIDLQVTCMPLEMIGSVGRTMNNNPNPIRLVPFVQVKINNHMQP